MNKNLQFRCDNFETLNGIYIPFRVLPSVLYAPPLAEFERNLIAERTRAGLDAARARGRKGGRPKALDAEKRKLLIDLYEQKKTPINTLCEMMQISKPTLYAYVKKDR